MMKKMLFFIVYGSSLMALYAYLKAPTNTPIHLSPEKANSHEVIKEISVIDPIFTQINDRNNQIKSLICDQVEIVYYEYGAPYRFKGEMAYEKDNKFRLLVSWVLGKEMDLGSNANKFWFWSKRFSPSLYYADHKNLNKTMLKGPLNPNWIMEAFSINAIETSGKPVGKLSNGNWALFEQRENTLGQTITKVTLIDPSRQLIIGHYAYDLNGKMEVSAEIEEFQNINGHIVPKKITILWYTEGIKMHWNIKNPLVNESIDESVFQMPKMKSEIDMGQ